ncbi:MAG: dienelactone hydrolase family protein [Williamsia sp.]|nr:dienelactone hydrolase family protein [Williamsia sp.]
MHRKNLVTAGQPLEKASRALIMLHGRGANAQDILSLASYLRTGQFALLAPEATNYTWYPFSFLAPPQQNEPWLSSALEIINGIVEETIQGGIKAENIFFAGFSQGACLTLEYTTRHARKWGGIVAFTGGLIGDQIYPANYTGNFAGTPVFIGSSDPDPHVPVDRVNATALLLQEMGAAVTKKIYPGMGHTINEDEIKQANLILERG